MEIRPLTKDELEVAATHDSDNYEAVLARLRWCHSTPYAHVFGAVQWEDDILGAGCCFWTGEHGRITLLRAEAGKRHALIRGALMEALVAHMDAIGCTTQFVTVAPADVPVWEALGFVPQHELLRYSGGRFLQATRDEVLWSEPQHRLGIIHLDRTASGMDRHTLLLEHEYLTRVYVDGTRVRGFASALLGDTLIIADAEDVGLELQRWIFSSQEFLLLPAGNAAHEHLTERGYTTTVEGICMVRGTPPKEKMEMVFAEAWGRA